MNVLPHRFCNLPQSIDPLGIGVGNHLQQHLWVVAAGTPSRLVSNDTRKVHLLDRRVHRANQLTRRDEIFHTRVKKGGLVLVVTLKRYSPCDRALATAIGAQYALSHSLSNKKIGCPTNCWENPF